MGGDPWKDLSARDHIEFARVALPDGIDGMYASDGSATAIVIAERLPRRVRRSVLAHELCHDDRGIGHWWTGMPDSMRAVALREEQTVERLAARRLVPLGELAELRRIAEEMGDRLDVWQVAEHFDVSDELAATAMVLLEREGYGG